MLQNLFFALAPRSGFGATISVAVALSSMVLFAILACFNQCNVVFMILDR